MSDLATRRVAEEGRRVQVNGTGIHVTVSRAAGRPTGGGRALVCLHGGPGIDGSGVRWMFSALTDIAEVIVPDQRGHGLSELSTPDMWNLDTWADDLAELIEVLELDRPVVFGVSFGGWVALRHAARHPRQAGGLVVAAMTPRLPTLEQVARRMGAMAGAAAQQAWLDAHLRPSAQAETEMKLLCLPLMARRPASPALAAVRAAQRRTPQVDEHFTAQFQRLDLSAELRAVACPTLVVLGELDPFVTEEAVTSTVEALPPCARLITVPDAAHDLFSDAPDTLLDEVRRFVLNPEGVAGPGGGRG